MKFIIIFLMFMNFSYGNDNFIRDIQRLRMSQMITRLNPKVTSKTKKIIVSSITEASKAFSIDPRLFLIIISIESNFNQASVSHTGDFSIAQIYFKYWSKRKSKLKKTGHLLPSIKTDIRSAILIMGEILFLEKKTSGTNKHWYANYHSRTPKFRKIWLEKLKQSFYKIKDIPLEKELK